MGKRRRIYNLDFRSSYEQQTSTYYLQLMLEIFRLKNQLKNNEQLKNYHANNLEQIIKIKPNDLTRISEIGYQHKIAKDQYEQTMKLLNDIQKTIRNAFDNAFEKEIDINIQKMLRTFFPDEYNNYLKDKDEQNTEQNQKQNQKQNKKHDQEQGHRNKKQKN